MALMPHEPLLVAIVGPTASGKTALSIALAERFGGEIVSCDSVAVYRGFEIGTAKPSKEEQARVPHHMLDVAEPSEAFTAGDYLRMARGVLRDIARRGKLPIVVGGTGLYLRALLEGLFAGPPRSEELRERLRESAEEHGPEHLHEVLRHLDPAAAEKIHANDHAKLIRAIEVCMAARTKMSEMWKQGRDALTGFRILRIGLDPERELLYEHINQRAAKMFANGLVEETRRLMKEHADAPALNSLGYKQAVQMIRGEVGEAKAIAAAQQGHRNYAKRQMTWFRRERDVEWLRGFGGEKEVQNQAESLVARQ
jgi:tRNA dimethylallyltransferase